MWRKRVARGFGRAAEQLPHQQSSVHLHLRGQFVAEEWFEQEVQLLRLAEPLDSRIAKADALFLGFGDQRDIGLGGKRHADAGPMNCCAELCPRMDMDDNTVLHEGHMRRIGIDVAGRRGVAADIVAPLWAIEELRPQGTFKSLRRYLYFNRRGGASCEEQKRKKDEQTKRESAHMLQA